MKLELQTVISERYKILELLGVGGMSNVYCALDLKLDRKVSFKVLKEDFIDEEFIEKFSKEARAAAKISHINIANVYDVGNDGNVHYIVMEYIDGYTLKDVIKTKAPFSNEEVLGMAIQVANALEVAHGANIIHRDIKPQNILVTKEGAVKVTDFGIARFSTSHTITMEVMGSAEYFSPEQAKGGYIDFKTDIYSLGIMMYEMITGKLPFFGEGVVQLAMKHINDPMPDMRDLNPNISKSLEKIILKATEKSTAKRYSTSKELNRDLKQAISDESGDFVKNSVLDDSVGTVIIKPEELEQIRNLQASYLEDDFDDFDFNEFDDLDGGTIGKTQVAQNIKNSSNNINEFDEFDDFDNFDDFDDDVQEPAREEDNYPDYNGDDIMSVQNNFENEPNNKNKKGKSSGTKEDKKITALAIVTALIIMLGVTVAIIYYLFYGQSVSTPNFKNKSWDEALAMAVESEIYVTNNSEEYSQTVPEGYIIEQDISAGTKIEKGENVNVTFSLGSGKVELQSFVGLDISEVYYMLDDLGFDIVEEYIYDDDVEIGKVVKQEPKEGTAVFPDQKVIIYVSRGEEDEIIQVPNVVGKSESSAKSTITGAGFKVGSVKTTYSNTVNKGVVVSQTPRSSNSALEGTSIDIVVSLGEQIQTTTVKVTVTTTEEPTTEETTEEFDDELNEELGDEDGLIVPTIPDKPAETEQTTEEVESGTETTSIEQVETTTETTTETETETTTETEATTETTTEAKVETTTEAETETTTKEVEVTTEATTEAVETTTED